MGKKSFAVNEQIIKISKPIILHCNWRKIFGADIAGAIGGFFGILFTGGAALLCALGGAIGDSLGEAVLENIGLD